MQDNVVKFPGGTTIELPPDTVLENVPDGMQSIMVVGIDADGLLYVAATTSNLEHCLTLLERSKLRVLDLMEG